MSATDNKSALLQALHTIEALEARLAAKGTGSTEPIAIVGIGCRFPGAARPAAFWNLIASGTDATRDLPPGRWDHGAWYDPNPDAEGKLYVDRGGYLDTDPALFDAAFFGVSPREAAAMDPQQRLLLRVAWESLEDAHIPADSLRETETGVYVGIMTADYARLQAQHHSVRRDALYLGGGTGISFPAGRLSYTLGCQGPSMVVATACSSSLVAVHLAANALRAGECNLALAGGVNLILSPEPTVMLSRMRALSRDGRSKSFSADADGYGRAEGSGVIVLQRLADAKRDGNRIYAVIQGSATNHDGPSGGLTIPSGPAQEKVIRKALANAGVTPAQVAYVEAHGTGTALGDPIEARALGNIWSEAKGARLAIGSVKTNIGHAEASAGIAGLIKTALALHHGVIPPSLHFEKPNLHIPWSTLPVEVNTASKPWPQGRPFAGVSSFGLSGINAHVLLSSVPETSVTTTFVAATLRVAPLRSRRTHHLLPFSARTEPALTTLATSYAALLPDADYWRLAASAARGRAHFDHRLTVNATSRDEALRLLTGPAHPKRLTGRATADPDSGVAFLFTGQGAQYTCMALALYESEPFFHETLDHCARLLDPHLGKPLLDVLFPPPGGLTPLDQTAYTQPALFAVEYALAQLWLRWGIRPRYLLGHSVGEIVAACIAGVFSLEDGLRFTARRAHLMGSLPLQRGGMAAVFAEESRVRTLLNGEVAVAVAAVNGPENVVVSGDFHSLDRVLSRCAAAGVASRRLNVSHAFHSPALDAILPDLEAAAREIDFHSPRMNLVAGRTGEWAGPEIAAPDYWVRQARDSVQFAAGLQLVYRAGCRHFLEIGPKPVLVNQGRAIVDDPAAHWLASLNESKPDWEILNQSVAALYVDGYPIDWRAFQPDPGAPAVDLPLYPFQEQPYWIELRTDTAAGTQPGGHPLLGERIESPLDAIQFHSTAGIASQPWLADHRVFGHPLMPAAAYCEMALAAAGELIVPATLRVATGSITNLRRDPEGHEYFGAHLELAEIEIEKPCPLPEGNLRFQTVIEPAADGVWNFSIHSFSDEWTRHCRGVLRDTAPRQTESLDDLRQRLTTKVDVDAFYAQASARGVEYGPAFRGIAALWRGDKESLAHVHLPAGLSAATFLAHPALLDAALQSAGALLHDEASSFLPVSLTALQWSGDALEDLWVHARLVPGSDAGRTIDYHFYAPTGESVGHIDRLFAREVQPTGSALPLDWLCTTRWEPAALNTTDAFLPAAGDLADAIAPAWQHWLAAADLDAYRALRHALDAFAVAAITDALARMGEPLNPGTEFDETSTAARLGVAAQHRQLFHRLLAILAEEGILERRGDSWRVLTHAVPAPCAADSSAAMQLLSRCAGALPQVLRGQTDPLTLLFPSDGSTTATRLYETDLGAIAMNALAREAIQNIVDLLPAGRALRVLEAGAGTGGTTPHLLSALPLHRTDYCFTDVSAYFTERAKDNFRSYPFVRTHLFDLEKDPLAQGFEPGSFDVIVAANVLHVVQDVRGSLAHLHTLLAPGGILLLVEATAPSRWLDLIFGLTKGWWNFADRDLRPDYPLLSADTWCRIARDTGFATAAAHAFDGQSLVVAAKPHAQQSQKPAGHWLVLSDRKGVGESIADRLRNDGCEVLTVFQGVDYRQLTPNHFEIVAASSSEIQLFVMEHLSPARPLAGVVYLWPLDPAPQHPDTRVCLPLLNLLRNLVRGNCLPKFFLATDEVLSGVGLPACPRRSAASWDQAQLWGMAKSARLEHPDLALTCIDTASASALYAEITHPSTEHEIASRGKDRYVARLTRIPREAPAATRPDAAFALRTRTKGDLDALHLAPLARRTPGPGEIEIEVRAAGLNFLDVLDALGALPFERGWLGGECAGIVSAIGPNVTGFQPGDAVVALAAGAFATHVIADARVAAHKPRRLTFAEAAGFPVAFLTAELALRNLTSNQSILIHAISGGTGLAAYQLARRAGAEVFGTASPAKWDTLRALGIERLMNSRMPSFANEVLARTQGRGVDVILNSLTGDFIPAGLRALAPDGRFLEIGKSEIWTLDQVRQIRDDVHYETVDLFAESQRNPAATGAVLRQLAAAFDEGTLDPLPVTEFPVERSVPAFRAMQQAKHIGKIVVTLDAPPAIRADATYLIAGGSSGLGLLTADWLIERGARNLVLVSRRATEEAMRDAVAPLRARGCHIQLAALDIADRDAVAALLAQISSDLPPLRGIVHAAGLLDDGILTEMEWPRFNRVLAPKVAGAWNLHDLTREAPLDFFVAYSSVAAVFGSISQTNHSAANAFLDALIAHRRSLGLPGLSINWGPWSDFGGAAKLPASAKERQRQMGFGAIPTPAGRALLDYLWRQPHPNIAVAPIDWSRFASRIADQPFFEDFLQSETTSAAPRHAIAGLTGDPLRRRLGALLLDELRVVLGQPATWLPDEEQGFFGFGMDSLTSLELRNRLQKLTGLTLPVTLLFDYPSPEKLVGYFAAQFDAPPAPSPVPAAANAASELDGLNTEELARLLAAQLSSMDSLE